MRGQHTGKHFLQVLGCYGVMRNLCLRCFFTSLMTGSWWLFAFFLAGVQLQQLREELSYHSRLLLPKVQCGICLFSGRLILCFVLMLTCYYSTQSVFVQPDPSKVLGPLEIILMGSKFAFFAGRIYFPPLSDFQYKLLINGIYMTHLKSHCSKQAHPITPELLLKIYKVLDL